jgi:hypothetical protein
MPVPDPNMIISANFTSPQKTFYKTNQKYLKFLALKQVQGLRFQDLTYWTNRDAEKISA